MNKRIKRGLSDQDKKYLDLLLKEREQYESQMDFHSEEALHFEKGSASEISGMSSHIADCATDSFQHEIELTMMTNEGDIIEQIDEAIERLESGDYGYCHDCAVKINSARLEVIPHTRLCINCQAVREKHSGMNPEHFDYDDAGNEMAKASIA